MNPNDPTHYVDAGAIAVAVGALAGYLPAIASLLTIVWMVIRIYETETVRGWVKREQRSHELRVYKEAKVQQAAKAEVVAEAKIEAVEQTLATLPIHPVIAEAIKEKVLSNDKQVAPTERS